MYSSIVFLLSIAFTFAFYNDYILYKESTWAPWMKLSLDKIIYKYIYLYIGKTLYISKIYPDLLKYPEFLCHFGYLPDILAYLPGIFPLYTNKLGTNLGLTWYQLCTKKCN